MRRWLIVLAGMLFAAPLFPESLTELMGRERALILRDSETALIEVQMTNSRPLLLPGHGGIEQIVADVQQSFQPSVMVEALFLFQKPGNAAGGWTESERTGLFNQALALSTLAGLEYYSASRNTMRTFYDISHIVEGPNSRRLVADPVYAEVPQSLTLYARHRDYTFGDNIYRYDYHSFSDAFVFAQQNMSTLYVGILPVIRRNNMRSVMAVLDCDDSLLMYAVFMARAALSLPGMEDRISASFANRAEAILKWFVDRTGNVYPPM